MDEKLEKQLNSLIKDEASRIMKIFLKIYSRKVKVNKIFDDLIVENLKEEFIPCRRLVIKQVYSLIPSDLMICPTNEYLFVTNEEYNEIVLTRQFNSTEKIIEQKKKITENVIKKIVDNYKSDKLDQKNILEIINFYTSKKDLQDIDGDVLNRMINQIIDSINDMQYKVININPLIVKGL